ncbi:MAG TPA: hypothetical protein VMH32_18980, partial [Burkholderiales bacterium]|nr:hypothetical protein [Burkholderiales bacterium]
DGERSLISTLTFSVPYTVASAILDRSLSPEHLTRDRIANPRVWELARKVRVVHDMDHTIGSVLADIPIGAAIKRARRLGTLRLLLGVGGAALAGKLLLSDPIGTLRLLRALRKAAGTEQGTDFSRATKQLSATVRIHSTRGQRFEETVTIPRGFAGSADQSALRILAREKYCTQAAAVIGAANAAQAADLIDRLEQLEPGDVQRLVRLNCEPR